MINEQFDDLFSRLENEARLNPFAYLFTVFLLSSLGNAYVGVIVLILLGCLQLCSPRNPLAKRLASCQGARAAKF
jgi:hypothetical protein